MADFSMQTFEKEAQVRWLPSCWLPCAHVTESCAGLTLCVWQKLILRFYDAHLAQDYTQLKELCTEQYFPVS